MVKIKHLFALIASFFLCTEIQATHIVGGEVTYRCLGNNNYEVSVTVYRDCDTGVPWFDNPASIGVFDVNNQLLMDLRLPLRNNDTLDLFLTDTCFVAPPNVCIHKTTYLDTVNLPFRTGGYQLVYQRCCRNQDIVNIVNPLGTGATYMVTIPETALNTCNSSPVFRDYPPVYLCRNVPIVFDHSAFDLNGDSIVYELYTPFDGATPLNPMPQPPFNPPYTPVTWIAPYSLSNVLGGTDVLRIDPQTGLLEGTPTIIGVFVVGIRALEFRNGQLIGVIQRDFQYAVGECGRRDNAAFFTPTVVCNDDLLVSFQNTSNSFSSDYRWDFGDLNTVADTSRLTNPVYIYPDTGTYTVRLIVAPTSTCSDTFYRTVRVQYQSLNPQFSANINGCSDRATVTISNVTTDSLFAVNDFFWDFGVANISFDTARGRTPTYTYNASGTYVIRMWATAANGCRDSITDTVSFNLVNARLNDTSWACPQSSFIQLNPNTITSGQTYSWSPPTGLNNPNLPSPLLSPLPAVPTVYTATVTAPSLAGSNLTCTSVLSTVVAVPPPLTVDIITDTSTCAAAVLVTAVPNQPNVAIEWSSNGQFNPVVSTQNPYNYQIGGLGMVYVRATDRYGCQDIDSVRITTGSFGVATNFTHVLGTCANPRALQLLNLTTDTSRGAIAGYQWTVAAPPNGSLTYTSTATNPSFNLNISGVYTVTLQATTVQACVGFAQSLITVLAPSITSLDTAGICPGTTFVQLNPNGDNRFSYLWSPSTNLSSVTAVSPSSNTATSRTYYVTITGIVGTDTCRTVDSVRVIRPAPLVVNVDSATIYCSNTVTLAATTNRPVVSYEWSGDPSFFTIINRSNPATITPTVFPTSGYYVRVRDNYGCTATDFAIVQQRVTPVAVNFSYGVVSCADTLLAQFNDITLDTSSSRIISRQWTVSNGQSSTLTNPSFVFRQSGIYQVTLTVRLANGCVGTLTRNVSFEIAEVNSNDIINLCGADSSVQLNPNGDINLDYIWSPAVGLSATNIASPIATPPSFPFNYTVTVTGNNGLDACVSVYNILIQKPSTVFIDLMPDTVTCANNVLVNGTFDPLVATIDWSFNNQFNPIAISGIIPINLGFGGAYNTVMLYARVVDVYGCDAVDSVRVERQNLPLNAQFNFTPECTNQLTVDFLHTGVNPRPIMDYSWSFGNGQTANYANPRIVYNQSGSYPIQLQVTDSWGCVGVFDDTLNFNLAQLTQPDSIAACQAGNFVLNPNGNPNLSYTWSPANLLNNPNAVSPVANVQQNTTFTAILQAANPDFVCADTVTVSVGVGGLSLTLTPDTAICGSAITLGANSPQATSFLWALDNNFNLPLGYGSTYTTNVNNSRYFYVLASDNYGCFVADSVLVTVNRNPLQAAFLASTVSCGDALNLQFSNITDTSRHSLVGWGWNFGDGGSATVENPSHNYISNGNYTVIFTITASDGCIVNSSQPISIQNNPLTNQNDTLTICLGDSIRLNQGGDSLANYQWGAIPAVSNPLIYNPIAIPTQNSNYQAQVTTFSSINGRVDTCVQSLNIRVEVTNPPTISLQDSVFICATAFSVQGSSNANSFSWSNSPNFNPILSTTNQLNAAISQNTQTFYLRAANGSCQSLDSVVISSKPVAVTLNDSSFTCQLPTEMNLTASVGGNINGLQAAWSPASAIIQGQGAANVLVDLTNALNYTVIVRNTYGCVDTATANISVSGNAPLLEIYASRDSINAGDTLQLSATPNLFNYQWETNPTLSVQQLPNAIASPTQPTTYVLSATDIDGCITVDSITIWIRPNVCGEPYIFIPNAFTPDGDGLNDELFVRGLNLTDLYFAVYNRWGELVFETNNQNIGWNGKFKGQELTPDVYGFYLQCTCADGQRYFKKGNVTLIR